MVVNGKEMQITEGLTVEKLLQDLKLDSSKVVVELDLNIIPRGEYAITKLNTNSKVEIMQFVGGG